MVTMLGCMRGSLCPGIPIKGEGVGQQRCNRTVKIGSLGTFLVVSKSSNVLVRKTKRGTSLEGRGQDVEGGGNKVVESQTQRTWFMKARQLAPTVGSQQVRSSERDSVVKIKCQGQNDC